MVGKGNNELTWELSVLLCHWEGGGGVYLLVSLIDKLLSSRLQTNSLGWLFPTILENPSPLTNSGTSSRKPSLVEAYFTSNRIHEL